MHAYNSSISADPWGGGGLHMVGGENGDLEAGTVETQGSPKKRGGDKPID